MGNGREVRPPIEESGTRLATFERKGFAKENRPAVELRVSLDDFDGKPFVTIRQWETAYGRMVPTKRGTSIRLGEIPGLIEALERAQLEANLGKKIDGHGEDIPPMRRPRDPKGAPNLPIIEPEPVDDLAEYRERRPRRPSRG